MKKGCARTVLYIWGQSKNPDVFTLTPNIRQHPACTGMALNWRNLFYGVPF